MSEIFKSDDENAENFYKLQNSAEPSKPQIQYKEQSNIQNDEPNNQTEIKGDENTNTKLSIEPVEFNSLNRINHKNKIKKSLLGKKRKEKKY